MKPQFLVAIMGIIWPFLAIIVFLYLHYTYKNRIHMALIESGRDASILRTRRGPGNQLNALKFGVVAVMAGFGLLFGTLLEEGLGVNGELASFSSMLFFVGLGLIGFYFYVNTKFEKTTKKEEEEFTEMV